jgi:3-hydroxybutyryl-CoA dehydratase
LNDLPTNCIEDLAIGMEGFYERQVTERDIALFAEVSGDFNPVHMDEAYAAATFFRGRIAHGILSASFISTVLGTKLPGPGCIYVSQTLNFLAPVRIGDVVRARVTITNIDLSRARVRFDCVCEVEGKPVVKGEAVVFVPSRGSARD